MHLDLQKRITRAVGKEVITRALQNYFTAKGYKPFSQLVYPPHIRDISAAIPEIYGKLELIPSPDSIDPTTGIAKLRWDLFVLGTNRMCLGQTTHSSLAELSGASNPNLNRCRLEHNAQQLIDFIVTILEQTEDGLDLAPPITNQTPLIPTHRPRIGPSQGGDFYERNRLV